MATASSPAAGSLVDSATRAEAARYALLRRLAPSMRHHLVVNLQPIGMIYEVMDRRLKAPEPNLANVQESAQKINTFARAALDSCLDVVTWLSPEAGAVSAVDAGVRESISLLATSLSFRGYAIRNQVDDTVMTVPRPAIRSVLTATLIFVTDAYPPPAELVVSARADAGRAEVTVELKAATGEKGFGTESSYRALAWADVEALAAAEAVGLERHDRLIRLSFPLTPAPAA